MWKVPKHFSVRIGGITYIDVANLVAYKGEPLFTLKRHDDNGYLGIYCDIYDAQGKRVAAVRRNEIYFGDKEAYKIDGTATRYILSDRATGRVICDIAHGFDAAPWELAVAVHLYTPSGFLFDATPDGTNLPGNISIRNSVIQNCTFGIVVD